MLEKSRQQTIVIVISSEYTWQNLGRYCFNEYFRANRDKFDLCVAFNGDISAANSLICTIGADYILKRPNYGMDPAALDLALKSLPLYEYYLILHDDHWFGVPYWFDYLMTLMYEDGTADAYGNLVTTCPYNSPAFDAFFDIVSSVIIGNDCFHAGAFPYYLQGMAGLIRGKAILRLLQGDGVPHVHCNNKKTVEVCERLFSHRLLNERMVLKQIPPGYELFLRHRDHNKQLADSISL